MFQYFYFSDRRTLGVDADVVAGGVADLDAGAGLDGQADLLHLVVRQSADLRAVHGRTRPLHLVIYLDSIYCNTLLDS